MDSFSESQRNPKRIFLNILPPPYMCIFIYSMTGPECVNLIMFHHLYLATEIIHFIHRKDVHLTTAIIAWSMMKVHDS